MGYYFRGTSEEMMAMIRSDLSKVSTEEIQDGYLDRALCGLVGLIDRQAELGALDPAVLKTFLDEIHEKLLTLPDHLREYPRIAREDVAAKPNLWYEICIARSAIQYVLDTWPGTPLAACIQTDDVADLDRDMRRVGLTEGPIPDETAPKGLPASHWWWKHPSL